MLSKEEQLFQLIKNHKNKLLLAKNEMSGDLFGTLLAWAFFLSRINGKIFPTIYLSRYWELKKIYSFLPKYNLVINKVNGDRDFILSFNTQENDIDNVRWKKENGHLDIIITPQKGSIDPRDFSFLPAKFRYDLIMTFGAADFGDLGPVYEENSDLFFELPLINIDTNPGNENYGQLNIVKSVPCCLAELSVDLMRKINEEAIHSEVAQCLLTALVEATDNLKNPRVTPHTFDITAFLMERGGNHQEILSALYDTESLNSLKLWGKLLERLKEEENLIWSFLEYEEIAAYDFPRIMLQRFFVRLKNYLDLGNKKLTVLWKNKSGKLCGFVYKINREEEKDRKIMEVLGGELFNAEILYFSLRDESYNFLNLVDKIKQLLKID